MCGSYNGHGDNILTRVVRLHVINYTRARAFCRVNILFTDVLFYYARAYEYTEPLRNRLAGRALCAGIRTSHIADIDMRITNTISERYKRRACTYMYNNRMCIVCITICDVYILLSYLFIYSYGNIMLCTSTTVVTKLR